MAETGKYRCCYCGTTNERTFDRGEMKRGLHKRKTVEVACSTCDDTAIGNKRGA